LKLALAEVAEILPLLLLLENSSSAEQEHINKVGSTSVTTYQHGNLSIEVRSVDGMHEAASSATGNPESGLGAGGISADGKFVIYVDADEWAKNPDAGNPLNNSTVNHEKSELAREVRIGRKLQQTVDTKIGERPTERLIRSPQFTQAAQNAHENAPEISWKPDVEIKGNDIAGLGSLNIPEGDPSVVRVEIIKALLTIVAIHLSILPKLRLQIAER